jgi:hypothetical protein
MPVAAFAQLLDTQEDPIGPVGEVVGSVLPPAGFTMA